ncbi:hypothetical protein BU15DRAFT_73592 [Melanogaster broomeanus]|nr:hypothetical protein BU15DRAFT_73592 [Melanogaster broomeanus]
MRSIFICVFTLFLVVLTTAIPLRVRVIHPKPLYVLEAPVSGSAPDPLSAVEGPWTTSDFQTRSDILLPSHETTEQVSLESIVKSIRPVRYLKETYAEVTVYLQNLPTGDN